MLVINLYSRRLNSSVETRIPKAIINRMLKKEHRLNKTRDLNKVYRTGRTAHTSALVIKFLEKYIWQPNPKKAVPHIAQRPNSIVFGGTKTVALEKKTIASKSKTLATKPKIKVGIVVSNKVSKRAVQRNRIKRVLRDEIRLRLSTLKPGEYMIIAKKQAAQIDNSSLRQELEQGLLKSYYGKIYNNHY